MMNLFQKQRPSSILGLAFDGSRMEAVVLRRTNGSFQAQQTLTVSLALSPMTGDPELVGREIRNHLEQAGIRERRCAVCIPLNWVMTLQTQLPDLPEADIDSFLQIEAERGFPASPETLVIAQSRCSGEQQYATLLGVSRSSIANLEQALKSAHLKPASFSLGITALQNPNGEDSLTLSLGVNTVEFQAVCASGIAALRSLDGATESEGPQKRLDAEILAREIRITLGQLPPAFQNFRALKIFGRGDLARKFVAEISPRMEAMGLKVEHVERCGPGHFENVLPKETPLSPALALAAFHLGGTVQKYEFLPPKVHPWRQLFSTKYSTRKLAWAGGSVGALVLAVLCAFAIQQWKIVNLENTWKTMEPKVAEVAFAKEQTARFKPWFDDSFTTLSILRRLTEAFPEDGSVSAKTLEIREPSTVTCSAVARDMQAYLKLLDKLRATKGITNLNFEQGRGQSPVLFTFNFRWEGANAN